MPKAVLALYTDLSTESVDDTPIHRFLEFPLNHLGLDVSYRNISDGLPDLDADAPDFVVTWFDDELREPDRYVDWLRDARDRGVRIAMFGQTGLPTERANDALELLGLRVSGYVPFTSSSRVGIFDTQVVGFECRPDPALPPYPLLARTASSVVTHLSVVSDEPGFEGESSLVSTGPGGGYVAGGFAMCTVPDINRVRWLIDPFAFFERAFGLGLRPVPDTTTLSGRRVYFSHVDGDGWRNFSEVALEPRRASLSARVLAERLFKTYPDLPVGIGLVGGELDPELSPVPDGAEEAAREIYALPNVEVAAHGYSHPIRWEFFEGYDRALEQELMATQATGAETTLASRLMESVVHRGHGHENTHEIYYGGELARVMLSRPFSLEEEIAGALRKAASYAPEGKTAKLFLWTGNARPFEAAVALTRKIGVGNMNGGDSRFDGQFPSVAYLSPLSRPAGDERQIYSGAANEALFTDGWRRNFHGQLRMIEFLERTAEPRRLKPFNLYYHTYSGDKYASLRALETLHELASTGAFIPVWPSRYVQIAEGFFDTQIVATAPLEWRISNRGGLQTVRFDQAEGLHVNPIESTGVIGETRINGSLYVALDPAHPVARLRLSGQRVPGALLSEANWELSDFDRRDCGFSVTAVGFGEGVFEFKGLRNGPRNITVTRNDEVLATMVDRVHGHRLSFKLPDIARQPARVEVSCPGVSR